MTKLDDIFEANTKAVTKYHDSDGDEVTDFDTVLLDTYTAKQQIKDLMLDTDFSLTFEEQRLIERLAMNATTPSSNQNKHRYSLFAEIAQIAEGKLRSKVDSL